MTGPYSLIQGESNRLLVYDDLAERIVLHPRPLPSSDDAPPMAGDVAVVRAAARALLGPVKSWASHGFMSRKRERELDHRVARLGVVSWSPSTTSTQFLNVGPNWVAVKMGPGHERLARWAARLIAIAELTPDPPAELLALATVLRESGRAIVSIKHA